MKHIGLLSDTHGYINHGLFDFFNDCDEIWHSGDFGNLETAERLSVFKPLRGVYGNIDGHEVRVEFKKHNRFMCEEVDVWITHIGGYPGKYAREVIPEILNNPPKLFISGHSHICKVMFDKKLDCLHINPGAAGKTGVHTISTAVRFTIKGKEIKYLEILEMKK